jgi:hypothetical protein
MMNGRSAPADFGTALSGKTIRSSGIMVVLPDDWTVSIRPDDAFEIADLHTVRH